MKKKARKFTVKREDLVPFERKVNLNSVTNLGTKKNGASQIRITVCFLLLQFTVHEYSR